MSGGAQFGGPPPQFAPADLYGYFFAKTASSSGESDDHKNDVCMPPRVRMVMVFSSASTTLPRIERRPNPRDRRSSVIRVTQTGVEEAMRHLGPLAVGVRDLAAGLREEERAAAGRYVEGVTAEIERHAREER